MDEFEFPSEVLISLKMLGIAEIVIAFSGSGDSGNIDDVNATDATGQYVNLQTHKIAWGKEVGYFDQSLNRYTTKDVRDLYTVEEVLKEICNEAINSTGLDWYNNDGGQGELTINLAVSPPTIELRVGINVLHTEDHHFEFAITTQEA